MEDVTFDKHKDTAYTCNISYKITREVAEEGDPDMDMWKLYSEIQFKKRNRCYLTQEWRTSSFIIIATI